MVEPCGLFYRELSLTKQSREGGEYSSDKVLRMSADGVRAAGAGL